MAGDFHLVDSFLYQQEIYLVFSESSATASRGARANCRRMCGRLSTHMQDNTGQRGENKSDLTADLTGNWVTYSIFQDIFQVHVPIFWDFVGITLYMKIKHNARKAFPVSGNISMDAGAAACPLKQRSQQ